LSNIVSLMANRTMRSLSQMFPDAFGGHLATGTKRRHATEYGWPDRITFAHALEMFQRNGLAQAAIRKTRAKTWQTDPQLRYGEEGDDATALETAVAERFTRIRLWQQLAEADMRGMVGAYGAAILRVGDGLDMHQPLGRAPGLENLVEVIPCWESQLRVAGIVADLADPFYGRPEMWTFHESAVTSPANPSAIRSFSVHPSRVLVFSRDGTLDDRSQLEAGYNAALDAEKVMGAGAEGFFKNSKGVPHLDLAEGTTFEQLAEAMGVQPEDVADKVSQIVRDFISGHDAALVTQNMKATFPNITMPQIAQFWDVSVRTFAASQMIPSHILTGMQTGERASKEDAEEWARTCTARRNGEIVPAIREMTERLVGAGVLPNRPWQVRWDGLMDDGPDAMIARAKSLSEINKNEGGAVFEADELRVSAGFPADIGDDTMRDDRDPRATEGDDAE
jgi:hypothetical protein